MTGAKQNEGKDKFVHAYVHMCICVCDCACVIGFSFLTFISVVYLKQSALLFLSSEKKALLSKGLL